MKRQIANNQCLRGNATRIGNPYNSCITFLIPVFIFQVKSWSDSTFCCFVHWKLVATLLKNNPAFYLVIIIVFWTFRRFREFIAQSKSAESTEIFKSWRFFIFLYWSRKGTVLIHQTTNSKCLRNIATRISQFLSVLVSRDPCFYFPSKKLVRFNFMVFCTLGTSFSFVKR